MGQAEVNHGSACPSTLKDEDSQPPQRVSPNFPELAQLLSDPCKTITNCPETVLKNLDRSPKVSLGKVLEIMPDVEVESSYTRHERSDTQNVSPVGPDKQQLEGTLVIHLSSKCKDINHSKMPMAKTSFQDLSTYNKDSNGPSFLDAGTQKMLETHLTRRLVRHRWSLPLRGIKTIHVFQRKKAVSTLPFPQTSNVYLSFGDSGDDSISTTASVLLETFQQAPEETVMKGDSPVESTQNSPPALQLEDLTATPHSDNSIPSEASTTIQEDSSTALSTRQDLIGRAWHHNNVLKSSLGNPEPIPDLVRGMCQSPGNEYGSSRDKYQGARNNSSASLSPSSRNTRELEEVEEEDSCELALTKPARELGNSSSNNKHLRDFGSLKITEISPSRTIDHMPEASGQRTRRCLAPPVVLQDCATGVFLQDCAPEVLLAADIMASRASQSSSKTKSTTRTSISQDRYPFSSREGAVPKKSIPQEPWNSHIFGPNYQKEDFKCPRQYICHSGKRPAHDAKSHSHEKKIVDMIKNFVLSIFNPKGKVQPNSRQKVKASSSPTQSQESVANRVFMPHKVTEGQDQKTSAGWVSVEKHRVHHRSAPSSNLQEPTKASMSRHVCHHRIPNVESKITQGNTSCVQQANSIVRSHPSTHKSMPYGNSWAQVLGQPVSQYANVQQMSQVPRVPGTPVHCPRHCCCRSVYGGKASAFPNLK
ncbi:FAM75-like protein C9orf79 [Cricetulus griseus]|uniref:FAM75-like protein C9orf79 n=1 Tax=Cricetulus griseus TaxID=10029 RepID=G3IK19_CRIGR|nr:FAM75-like protein C9orf79 [Cricetulus griseus]